MSSTICYNFVNTLKLGLKFLQYILNIFYGTFEICEKIDFLKSSHETTHLNFGKECLEHGSTSLNSSRAWFTFSKHAEVLLKLRFFFFRKNIEMLTRLQNM